MSNNSNKFELSIDDINKQYNNGVLIFNNLLTFIKENSSNLDNNIRKEISIKLNEMGSSFLKYMFLLHQYKDYYNLLNNYIYEIDSIKALIDRGEIEESFYETISGYENGDYDDLVFYDLGYLIKVFEKLFKKDYDKIIKVFENEVTVSHTYEKIKNIDMSDNLKYITLTNILNKNNIDYLFDKDNNKQYKSVINEILSNVIDDVDNFKILIGSLNDKKKELDDYNLNEVFKFVTSCFIYSECIKKKNDFNIDLNNIYYWKNCKKYVDLSYKNISDIEILMNDKRFSDDSLLSSFAFESKLDISDIISYSKIKELKLDELELLYTNNISMDFYNKLLNKNFDKNLIIKTIKLNGNNYENYNVNEKYFELLPYLNYQNINTFNTNDLDYLIDFKSKLSKMFNGKNYEIYFDAYVKLYNTRNEYEFNIIDLIDMESMFIDSNIRRYLRTTIEDSEEYVQNVSNNIDLFSSNTDVLFKVPILLNSENNKLVLDLLIDNGLDVGELDNFDSTIMCYPNELVKEVIKIMKKHNVDIIINNSVNDNLLTYVSQIMQKKMAYEFPPMIVHRNINNVEINSLEK